MQPDLAASLAAASDAAIDRHNMNAMFRTTPEGSKLLAGGEAEGRHHRNRDTKERRPRRGRSAATPPGSSTTTAQRPVVSAFGLNHRLTAAIPPGWNLVEASRGGFRYLTVNK